MTTGERGFPDGVRATGSGGDVRLRGFRRRTQGLADVGQPVPQFVFPPDLLDAERPGVADGGLLFFEPAVDGIG